VLELDATVMKLKNLFVWMMSGLLLLAACQSHRYALPSPKGPPQPKVKKTAKSSADQNADGTDVSAEPVEVKPQKNSYDKNGLLKKPKYERRRLAHKVGQRKFLGFVLPF
jgi:hypothetical protein